MKPLKGEHMKRVIALLLIAGVALFAATAPQSDPVENAGTPRAKETQVYIKTAPLPLDEVRTRTSAFNRLMAPAVTVDTSAVEVIYFEDFENGAPGWVNFDGTAPDPRGKFHLLDYFDTGDSLWWCGDPVLGGYLNNWNVALETPEVVLTGGDSILSFDIRMYAEPPEVYNEWDGWDGGNVQITNDGGATWTILQPTGVPYNVTSMYSFGTVLGMGPGVPGWGGEVAGRAEVNIAEYIGDTVKVRFVFVADVAYDVLDDDDLIGMMVDSIHVAGDAEFNGSVSDGLITYGIKTPSGSYWTVHETTDSIPSPTHALRNFDGDTYALNLEDYFVSPSIVLPDEENMLIFCDFEFMADFVDNDEFPDVEYWRMEFSPDNGVTWRAISNHENSGNPNYVYTGSGPNWYPFRGSFSYSECNLTAHAGKTVKFRFYFRSDGDTPSGSGLWIDDFIVYSIPDLPVPPNVVAEMDAEEHIVISWYELNGTHMLPIEFMGADPADCGTYNGPGATFFGGAAGVGMGMNYDTQGKDVLLSSLDFALPGINPDGDSISVMLYSPSVGVLYWSDNFVPAVGGGFESIDISDDSIAVNGPFRVLIFWETSASRPACYIDLDGSGMSLYSGGFYTAAYGTPVGAQGEFGVTYEGMTYNVYRRVATTSTFTRIASGVAENSYTDETAEPFVEYEYYVTSTKGDFESQPSARRRAYVVPNDVEEIAYDDGSFEDYFDLGLDTMVVIKITPSSYPAKLEALRFNNIYAGDAYKIKVFADDNGMPGESWLRIEPSIAAAIAGWNTFKLTNPITQTQSGIVLEDGESIWIGVKGADTRWASWLAMDMNSGYSGLATMQVPSGGWTSIVPVKAGNPMIRGYFDVDIDLTATEEIVPAKYVLSQNYPNPFNPVTTIRFELREAGMTKIEVFDITGRHVRTLVDKPMEAGSYNLKFDASALSSGIYFYRMTSGNFTDIKKMSLLK
jgi:hypothetical protein